MQSTFRNLAIVGIIFGVVLTVATGIWAWSLIERQSYQYPARSVTFSGSAQVTVAPDYADVTVSVVTQNASAQVAQEENDRKIQGVADYLKQQGIADADIQTVGYYLYPQYDYDYCRREDPNFTGYCTPRIVGYEMNQSLQFRVRDLDNVGTLLGSVTERGANSISGVQFRVEDVDAVRREAVAEALQKADEKARQYEQLAGLRLGKIVTISESGGDVYGGFYAEGKGGAAMSAPIEPGSQDVTLEVYVTYEVK